MSRIIIVIIHIRGLITSLKTTHEPPSMLQNGVGLRAPWPAVANLTESRWPTTHMLRV